MNDVRKPLGTVDSRWFFRPTRDSIERDCSAIFDIVIGIYIYIYKRLCETACRGIGRERY